MQSLQKGALALQKGAKFRGEAAWAHALPALQQCTAGQHGALQHRTERAHGAVRTPRWLSQTTGPGSYSTARCATAKHPSNAKCARKPGHYRAQQSAEKLGRDRNTRGTGTHSTHQHGHGVLGAGQ